MRKIAVGSVVLVIAAGAEYFGSPAVRAKVDARWHQVSGWSEEARQHDPIGYISFAESSLKENLTNLEQVRRELSAEMAAVQRKCQEKQTLLEGVLAMANEFREQYRRAQTVGVFPVTVRGAAYTEDQIVGQVRTLMAEAEACEGAVKEFKAMQEKAQGSIEDVMRRVHAVETKIELVGTQRQLIRAGTIAQGVDSIVADVDSLIGENKEFIVQNPVRSFRELVVRTATTSSKNGVTEDRVRKFLATGTTATEPGQAGVHSNGLRASETETSGTTMESKSSPSEVSKPASAPTPSRKPIFVQS